MYKTPGYTEIVAVLERHQDLVDELIAEVQAYKPDADRELLTRAFRFAATAHDGQLRRSGQEFIHHPWGAAKVLAGLRLDEATLAAALLHDTVEDTGVAIEDIRNEFGDEIAKLVEGVTKLTRVQFQSREHAEAENYRKLVVAMAEDVRVILIKLADRLHNLRTIEYMGKQTQVRKARETLEVYAPLAHRLGIHALKWELEDLAFQTLHPRKYEEIKQMVAERRADREEHVREASMVLQRELDKVDIPADISGRAKHFYSIYDKMAKKGREFNEIYDLTAMRVIVERDGDEGTRDCYGALGLIHSLWKPMPGRFKDYIAMPKFNGYRALHTTVIGPQGRPLEIQVRTREMHATAEYGVAAHWLYKNRKKQRDDDEWTAWVKQLMDAGTTDEADPREFMKSFRTDLFDEEVHVFTPKGQVKTLPAGSTPIDFAYAVHTDVGHRTVGAKVNGRIVPLHYRLKNGDFVEILTSKQGRGPSRDWLLLAKSSRARNKIRQWFSRETREDQEQKGRETLEHSLKQQNLPYAKIRGSSVLAQVIRDSGFKKAEDFYVALGSGKLSAGAIVNKVIQRLKVDQVAEEAPVVTKAPRARDAVAGDEVGVVVPGVEDVLVRLAKCCTPVPGDPIVGYISLGKGITIHRGDCPNVKALRRNQERFTPVAWDGGSTKSFRVQIAVSSWDRPRLLEDVARTFAEHGANIVSYGGVVEDQLAKNWYTVQVGDVDSLRSLLNSLRSVDAVFDAYRVTPS
jgi:GTP pyrophosphokinase